MIGGKKVLAVIPARGGSKGVVRKNLREVGGKPLIAWTIEAALASEYVDRAILSSEDAEIMAEAERWGLDVPFTRPEELAQDNISGLDVFGHALSVLPGYDYGVLLQPTSPLRTAQDIDGCIRLLHETGAETTLTVAEPEKSPYWMYVEREDGTLRPLIDTDFAVRQRQDVPRVLAPNGAVYVAQVDYFLLHGVFKSPAMRGYIMPRERSLDIDEEFDIKLCEWLLARAAARRAAPETTQDHGEEV